MKVEKLEIKKELLDIPEGQQRMDFEIIPPLTAMSVIKGSKLDFDVVAQKVTYEVQQVWDVVKGYRYYLVSIDDKGIFQDLVEITEQTVKKEVAKRTEELEKEMRRVRQFAEMEIKDARWSVVMSIKRLPWYTRLLNNF